MAGVIKRKFWLMVVAFSLMGCGGEAFIFRLRNQQNSSEYSTLHTMPDGDLLVLAKRIEQPKQIWKLRRIAGWDSQPREDEVDVDVGPNDELLDWSLQKDRVDRNDQLLMDPGGKFLVVRLSPNADNWTPNRDKSATSPQSVLNIIDLQGFKLLSRVVVTDPLLAEGDMGFSPTGAFVVSGLRDYSKAMVGGAESDTGQFAAETLTLPALKPETMCSYSVVIHPDSTRTPSTPQVRRLTEYAHRLQMRWKRNEDPAANKACRSKLAPLGFSSWDDVRTDLSFSGRLNYIADQTRNIPPQSPWGCEFRDLSGDRKYALYDCDESRVQFTLLFWYRGFRVFRLDDGAQIMDLKLPHSPEFSGVLATSRGGTYVVLLRDGAELEGYRVP